MTTQPKAHVYTLVRPWLFWASLATGAVVWAVHLLVSYALVSLACERGVLQAIVGGFPLARWLTLGLTLIAAGAVGYASLVAHRHWRQLGQTKSKRVDDVKARTRFMARLGVLLNGIFLLAIVVSLFPILFLPLCD